MHFVVEKVYGDDKRCRIIVKKKYADDSHNKGELQHG